MEEKIISLIDENSGGMKFTELVCKMVVWGFENHQEITIDILEECIRLSKHLKTLVYTSRLWNRQKIFIYTE